MGNTKKSGSANNWQDLIGKSAYYIKDNKLQKLLITEARKTVMLNMGSPDHGRLIPPMIEYRIGNDPTWYRRSAFALTKEELLNKID